VMVNVRGNTIAFFIYIDNATVRDACWRQNLPFNYPLDNFLKQRWYGIHFFISYYAWRVPIFILQGCKNSIICFVMVNHML